MTSETRTTLKVGSIGAILLGLSYIAVAISVFSDPAEQAKSTIDAVLIFASQRSPLSMLQYWAFTMGMFFAMAAIPGISRVVRDLNEGLVDWASRLACVGFVILSIENIRILQIVPILATSAVNGDESIRQTIALTIEAMNIDPIGILTFGGIGAWMMVVSLLGLRAQLWPKGLALLGLFGGFVYWFVFMSELVGSQLMFQIGVALGGLVVGPIWYIWMGFVLRRKVTATSTRSSVGTLAVAP